MMETAELLTIITKRGAEIGSIPGVKMCNDCAFKPGTEPQKDPEFLEYLAGHLSSGEKFYCHVNEGECAGSCYFYKYFEDLEKNRI